MINVLRNTYNKACKPWYKIRRGFLPSPRLSQSSWWYYSRAFSTTNSKTVDMSTKEITIPMPYGHLAGMTSGEEGGYPVLALHGWMDNCGTFVKLMPLLSKSLYVVALDMPGHGLSSHISPGIWYTYINMLVDLKRVFNFFGWKKAHVMGHSLGGHLGLFLACQYPELINKVVLLDATRPLCNTPDQLKKGYALVVDKYLEVEAKAARSTPIYTLEEAKSHLIQNTFNEITPELADILLKRGVRLSDCGKGWIFTRDYRLKYMDHLKLLSHHRMREMLSGIENEILVLKAASKNPFYNMDEELDKEFLELYKRSSKKFMMKTQGNHFFHLNEPETVANIINEFLSDETA